MKITHRDTNLLRKIMPFICLTIPWEIYFYSTGWGIKFSVFYANFDITYGTLFVSIFKQMTLLSYGGFLPSIRSLAWIAGAILCLLLAVYELLKEEMKKDYGTRTTGIALISCGILTFVSSVAIWNSDFKTLPVAPLFFIAFGYLLIQADKREENTA